MKGRLTASRATTLRKSWIVGGYSLRNGKHGGARYLALPGPYPSGRAGKRGACKAALLPPNQRRIAKPILFKSPLANRPSRYWRCLGSRSRISGNRSPRPASPRRSRPSRPEAEETGKAHPIDLLLDVELPVRVSFGRAQLPLKDVIKLTTSSIIELNRSVSEPVEVIVNNCVIARGEVVVVEGNFGVRIRQVISRQERLRTLT